MGAGEADCSRVSYSEGPQIVKDLFLRIPQYALNAFIPNEILFGARGVGVDDHFAPELLLSVCGPGEKHRLLILHQHYKLFILYY